jgi:hypothetical protein
MDKTKLGMAAALSAAVAIPSVAGAPAQAKEPPVPTADSYADLLQPIPNAVERLKAADEQDRSAAEPQLIKAQYYHHHHHHHHNHHYRYRRWWGGRWYFYDDERTMPWYGRRHHHHHHHHNNYYRPY